jgi:hypothetical protein
MRGNNEDLNKPSHLLFGLGTFRSEMGSQLINRQIPAGSGLLHVTTPVDPAGPHCYRDETKPCESGALKPR